MVVAFSSLARISGECSTIYSPTARFFFSSSSFFEVEIGSGALILYSVGQDQSTVGQRAETTVAECSLTGSLHVSSFSNRFPHYA